MSLFCSAERPEIKHLRLPVIYRHRGFINCVAIGEIRYDLSADRLDSFNVFLNDVPEYISPNLNASFFQSAGDSNQSVRDLSKQCTLNGKLER